MTAATIATANSTVRSYTYNGDGVRVSRTAGGLTTNYVQDVASSLPLVLEDGADTYVYGQGLISITDSSGVQTYRLTDGLGSTTDLVDATGNLIVAYTYDPFGAVRTQTTPNDNEWLFTGEQRDEESGYDFLRARYYDPEVGRFLGRDAASQGPNAYGYAMNSPLSMVDPSGFWTICAEINPDYGVVEGAPYCLLMAETTVAGWATLIWNVEQGWVTAAESTYWKVSDWLCGDATCIRYDGKGSKYWYTVCNGEACWGSSIPIPSSPYIQ